MNRYMTLAALLAVLAAGPALAQDTPAETQSSGPGDALPLGETADAQAPQGPVIYEREVHGAFSVRCARVPEGQTEPCQLFQRLTDVNGNPTADVNFFDVGGDGQVQGGATVVTPLQTLLTTQVTLSVDNGPERRYPFAFCDVQGCYARMGFTAAEMAEFRAGANAKISVRPALAPDQVVEMTISLMGFTAGMQAIAIADPQ